MSELSKIPPDVNLLKVMNSCWNKQSEHRPTMQDARTQTSAMHRHMKAYSNCANSWKSYLQEYRRKAKNRGAAGGVETKEEELNGGATSAMEVEMVEVLHGKDILEVKVKASPKK